MTTLQNSWSCYLLLFVSIQREKTCSNMSYVLMLFAFSQQLVMYIIVIILKNVNRGTISFSTVRVRKLWYVSSVIISWLKDFKCFIFWRIFFSRTIPFTICLDYEKQKKSKHDKFYSIKSISNPLVVINNVRRNYNAKKLKLNEIDDISTKLKSVRHGTK